MRLITISIPLRPGSARVFAKHFQDLFKPKFVCVGEEDSGNGFSYPTYVVCREPERGESEIEGHEMDVSVHNVLSEIRRLR